MLFRKCAASAASASFVVAAALSTLILPHTAKASPVTAGTFTITIAPDGAGNVIASGSGDVNISGGIPSGNNITNAFINPTGPFIFNGPALPTSTTLNTFAYPGNSTTITGPTTFGTTGETDPTAGSGSMFLFAYFIHAPGGQIDLYVPAGYATDTQFTDSSTYTGATLSSLGLTPGTYTWTTGSSSTMNTIKVIVTSTPVPEPASLSLLGVGSTLLLRRRRAL